MEICLNVSTGFFHLFDGDLIFQTVYFAIHAGYTVECL